MDQFQKNQELINQYDGNTMNYDFREEDNEKENENPKE